MAIYVPKSPRDFAVYTIKRPGSNILIGYEYEIHSPDLGAPGGWVFDGERNLKRLRFKTSPIKAHPIKALPPHYHVTYESLGGGRGYEIKSPVAPLQIHKQIVKRHLFPNITTNELPNGAENNGAIHVSIARIPFTETHHLKVFDFLHRRCLRKFLLALSERHKDTFKLFSPQHRDDARWHGHYNVINKENHNRYELRLFAAHKHLLIPALEMADSLFHLAAQVEKVTMENWTNFIASKLKYADLNVLVKKALA